MNYELKFKLDNPSLEKWELYKGLSASIDKIDLAEGVLITNREFNAEDYTLICSLNSTHIDSLMRGTFAATKLLYKHGITVTCVSAKQFNSPDQINIKMLIKLKNKFQNPRYWTTWDNITNIIDAECRKNNILVKRHKFPEKYEMILDVSFVNYFEWSAIGFFAGHLCGKAGIELDIQESVMDITTEDILDEITHITGRHRQLSLLDFKSKKIKRG